MADSLQHSEDSDRHSDSCAESVSVAPNVSVVTPAFDPAPSQASLQADTGNLQPDSGPAGERDRFLALLGWLVFVVLSVQYLIVAFDRPPPLPWQRGPAFSFYRVVRLYAARKGDYIRHHLETRSPEHTEAICFGTSFKCAGGRHLMSCEC